MVRRQLEAHLPEASFLATESVLAARWCPEENPEIVIIEFALAQIFMWPLAIARTDPFVGMIGSLCDLDDDEVGVYQVSFWPLSDPWDANALAAVTDTEGKPYFPGSLDLVKATMEKVSRPLYGAVVRIATRSVDYDRSWEIARAMASSLRVFARAGGQCLIPLRNEDYPAEAHQVDLLQRQSRRSGMILNVDELMGFVRDDPPGSREWRRAGRARSPR